MSTIRANASSSASENTFEKFDVMQTLMSRRVNAWTTRAFRRAATAATAGRLVRLPWQAASGTAQFIGHRRGFTLNPPSGFDGADCPADKPESDNAY
jgi:hypothetical protein